MLLLLITVLATAYVATTSGAPEHHKYCQIGAGPGGLQMGYFLERGGVDYVIFEKAASAGSFYLTYPRHRKLISINKRHTGQTNVEFNMRHDWNSLLSDDPTLLLKYYSKEMFPHADALVKYMKDYHERLGIKVRFNTEVSGLRPREGGDGYFMRDQNGKEYTCDVVLVATGLGKPYQPKFKGDQHAVTYDTMVLDPEYYEGKSVLVIGRGNTAFEIADSIYGNTNMVHMLSRSRVKLSWETHYVGDVRGINNALLDTYQLKSLDGILEADASDTTVIKRDGRLWIVISEGNVTTNDIYMEDEDDNFSLRDPYDVVILATGWQFDDSIFNSSHVPSRAPGRASKYVKCDHDYQVPGYPGMYLVGGNSHIVDYRKSAGGFIHGYRYTARTVYNEVMWRHEGRPWPAVTLTLDDLIPYMTRRTNEASGTYQMFSYLGDIIIPHGDGHHFSYLEEVPVGMLYDLPGVTGHTPTAGVIVLLNEYGYNFSGAGKDIFRTSRATGDPAEAHRSNFLHPVYYHYPTLPSNEEFDRRDTSRWTFLPKPAHLLHLVEDFTTLWTAPVSHGLSIRRFFENSLKTDMVTRNYEDCFRLAMSHNEIPPFCATAYLSRRDLPIVGF